MKKTNDVLGGFDAVFNSISSNGSIGGKGIELVEDPNDNTGDTVAIDIDADDDDDFIDESKLDNHVDDDDDTALSKDSKRVDNTNDDADDTVVVDESETEQVTAFFDAIAEQVGWSDITDEEKPKSVEDFVEYMKSAVEQSSTPRYANNQIAEMDEYVRNGGSISDYLNVASDINYDEIDLEDIDNQKAIVREFLSEKGFSDIQIKRKLEKYEDADLLEDESADAVEFLKETKEQKKKALLVEQKTAYEQGIQEQQRFYNNVVDEIEALTDVRGIKIPKEDKKALMEYIFKVEGDGRTRYQKEYASKTKNLIESAYFTWKGDALIDRAKRSGETSATERLKNTLKTNKVSGSKQTINNGSPAPLWSIASKQLLRRPQ
jgi:hypothetical protein